MPLSPKSIEKESLSRKNSLILKVEAISAIQSSALEKMEGVIGIDETGGQIQSRYWYRLALRTSLPETPLNEIIRRSAFMLMSSLTCVAGLIWGGMYVWLDEMRAAMYPITYSVLMTTCFLSMTQEGRYHDIVFVQLLLILLLPICLQIEVGGIIKSGGVVIWSFLCPLGAALFSRPSTARVWFVIYFVSVLATMFCEYKNIQGRFVASQSELELGLFTMNICGAMTITFFGALMFSIRLDSEYKRSEKLLYNVLPKSIAKRLKDGESHIIEHFDGVSILFADLVGFTTAAAAFHPNFLIGKFLSDVFSSWDKLCENRSLEKIKTIGDAFMAVGGIEGSGRTGSEVAVEMVLLALEMQQSLDQINKKYGMKFKVRIGLHSGAVIAGVIGVKKFAFDVWGDAVNTASRMESQGVPGCLHLSSDAYDKVRKHVPHFKISCRGEIDVKGKGSMTTYILEMPSSIFTNENNDSDHSEEHDIIEFE
jgi:adenylate cyclase